MIQNIIFDDVAAPLDKNYCFSILPNIHNCSFVKFENFDDEEYGSALKLMKSKCSAIQTRNALRNYFANDSLGQ